MPYNNTPITPTAEITGTVSLPRELFPATSIIELCISRCVLIRPLTVARVKKIIHADEDINNCSNNAAFAITIATEQFLQYLVEQTHNVVKSERKVRRNLQYRDVGESIIMHDPYRSTKTSPSGTLC